MKQLMDAKIIEIFSISPPRDLDPGIQKKNPITERDVREVMDWMWFERRSMRLSSSTIVCRYSSMYT